MDYQACITTPFAILGICSNSEAVVGIDFLPAETRTAEPLDRVSKMACEAITLYLNRARFPLDLPLLPTGTTFQKKVWAELRRIPCGQTITYSDLARRVGSGARAVSNACGANPIPLLIPCHRVVAKNGLGGFMQGREMSSLNIKRWLLEHERSASDPA